MSRPERLTPERQERFLQAVRDGAFPEVAARKAGFSPASFYRFKRGSTPEHAAFREAVETALVELEIRLSGTLVQAGMVDPRWALTLLERRFPERWGRRSAEGNSPAVVAVGRRPADDFVTLDPALADVIVRRLLAAGERLRSEPTTEASDTSLFESRRPGRSASDGKTAP